MPTIREVASACGVAPMTVSHVLNKPEKVAVKTRERVLRAIREMGYRPALTPALTSLEGGARVLGVFNCLDFGRSLYYQSLLNAILQRVGRTDHSILLFGGDAWRGDPYRSIRVHYDGHCNGLVYLAPTRHDPFLEALRDRGIPFVILGDAGDDARDASVDVDNVGAARAGTEYLLSLGHRRIAFVGRDETRRSTLEREQGYLAAMRAAGLTPDGRVISATESPQQVCRDWLASYRVLPSSQRPTAVFCWNDIMAEAMLHALRDARLRVPRKISVLGFDDLPEAGALPSLTTMRQPYEALGGTAVDLLLGQIGGEPPQTVLLPAGLVVRGSTGPAPAD